jgi:hypothetical protein
MSDSQFNGKRLFAYQEPGRPAKYDIVGTHIREVGKTKPTYEIRGRYIYRANAIGQPVYEITDNLVYQHLIAGQPIYEIR